MITMIELKAKNDSAAVTVPTVKLLFFSTLRLSSGGCLDGSAACRRAPWICRSTNQTMPTTPMSMASHTIGCVNGYDSMFVKPNMSPPKPKIDKPTEKKSALADASRVPKLRKPKIAKNSEITPMTVSVRKIDRQPFKSVCTPPNVGPIAGATLMAMPTVPIAIPRRERG